jgi:hypothetical protein
MTTQIYTPHSYSPHIHSERSYSAECGKSGSSGHSLLLPIGTVHYWHGMNGIDTEDDAGLDDR